MVGEVLQNTALLLAKRRAATRRRKLTLQVLENGVLLLVAIVILFPIVWMVLTSFKPPIDVYKYTIYFNPTLDNFREVFGSRWQVGLKARRGWAPRCRCRSTRWPSAPW